MELTGRGDYIQPSFQSIKLRNTLPALRSNDLFGGAPTRHVNLRRELCNASIRKQRTLLPKLFFNLNLLLLSIFDELR